MIRLFVRLGLKQIEAAEVTSMVRRESLVMAFVILLGWLVSTVLVAQESGARSEDAPSTTAAVAETEPGSGESLGRWAARKALRSADLELASKRYGDAAKSYGRVVKGVERASQRMRALYGEAIARLLDPQGDHEAAIDRLETLLAEYPQTERNAEATALLQIARMEAPAPAVVTEPVEATEVDEAQDESAAEAADSAVRTLERQVASLRRQLQEARVELEKKEEAIEKLKQLVVGDGS